MNERQRERAGESAPLCVRAFALARGTLAGARDSEARGATEGGRGQDACTGAGRYPPRRGLGPGFYISSGQGRPFTIGPRPGFSHRAKAGLRCLGVWATQFRGKTTTAWVGMGGAGERAHLRCLRISSSGRKRWSGCASKTRKQVRPPTLHIGPSQPDRRSPASALPSVHSRRCSSPEYHRVRSTPQAQRGSTGANFRRRRPSIALRFPLSPPAAHGQCRAAACECAWESGGWKCVRAALAAQAPPGMIALSESERVETLRVLLENKCAAAAAHRRYGCSG